MIYNFKWRDSIYIIRYVNSNLDHEIERILIYPAKSGVRQWSGSELRASLENVRTFDC